MWGYVEPVSTPFRNQFYLPYLLLAGGMTLLVSWKKPIEAKPVSRPGGSVAWGWGVILAVVFLGAAVVRTGVATAVPVVRGVMVLVRFTSLAMFLFSVTTCCSIPCARSCRDILLDD